MPEAEADRAVLLLVEDEAPNRALLKAIVSRASERSVREATLIEATDLAQARSALASGPVDVVILDVRLPDGNGLDLARELRQRPPAERPSVVVLSASVLPGERSAAIEAGADAFLPKPYDIVEVIGTLAGFLAQRGPGRTGS